jgi:hypothetical protein
LSDYLSGLAARSLPSTDVVLPRLASRFEPAPGDGLFPHAPAKPSLGLAGALEDFAELAAELAPPAGRRSLAPQLAAPALPALGVFSSGQPSNETSADVFSSRRRSDSQLATIVARAPDAVSRLSHPAQPAEPAPRPGSAASVQPTPAAAAPVAQQGVTAGLVHTRIDDSVRSSDQPLDTAEFPGLDQRIRSALGDALALQLAQNAGQDRLTQPRPEAASEVQPAAPARVVAQPQVAIASAARPAALDAAAAGRLKAQQEPLPAPTIHVTIGRIEVRATPAPASAPPSRPKPAPTMSLDDYLRQRNGGSR